MPNKQINIVSDYNINQLLISDSVEGSSRTLPFSEVEIRAALDSHSEIMSLVILHNNNLIIELFQDQKDAVWESENISHIGEILAYTIASAGKTNFKTSEVISSLGDNTSYTIYNIPDTDRYIWYDGDFQVIPKTSGGGSSGWSLTGNSGTDSEVNFIGTIDSEPLILGSNSAQTMEITSFGVTINPYFNGMTSTTHKSLQINQVDSEYGNGIRLVSDTSNDDFWDVFIDGDTNLVLGFQAGLVGAFDKSSGIYSPISDERLKQNIVPLTDQAKLLQLSPKQFTFKSDSTDKKRYGLIAQEVKAIIPEIVMGNELTGTLTVDYVSLIPLLIKQIQTLTAQVNALTI